MLSFWERESFIHYDYIVVGGGIVGLSTACSLKERVPKARVLVLERGVFPSGASTKNAGFACFGSITELLADWKSMGKEEALELVKFRYEGLKKLRARLGDHQIGYMAQGGYELIRKNEIYALDKIDEVNDWLFPYFEQPVFKEEKALAASFGFGKSVYSVISNPLEGQIDTGMMMRSLIAYARSLDVEIITGAMAGDVHEDEDEIRIKVKNTVGQEPVHFRAARVALCTNAFSRQFFPHLDMQPGRGVVLVTEEMEKVPFRGVFHMDEGYYYFRDFGNRIIFGGGRNLDFERERSTDFEVNLKVLTALQELLKTEIIPGTPIEIDMVWTGIMAFGKSKQPILQKMSKRMVAGIRLGGMGVAIGSEMGAQLAEMMIGKKYIHDSNK